MTSVPVDFENAIELAFKHESISTNGKENELDLATDLNEYKLQYQIDALKQANQESADNHRLRTEFAHNLFLLVCTWLICVIAAVLMVGFKFLGFYLADNVLIVFITTTTINVLGLFVIVAKWLFPNPKNEEKKVE